jgi:biopolymer transport protein ExbB
MQRTNQLPPALASSASKSVCPQFFWPVQTCTNRLFPALIAIVLFAAVAAGQPLFAIPIQESVPVAGQATEPVAQPAEAGSRPGMNLFRLLVQGGFYMIPLGLISLIAVAITVERLIALQRDRIMPERMIERLARLGQQPGGMDPRDAYIVCQNTPSVAADILRSVLVKVGRPHMELEHACTEAAQRAATRLQQPVSWLTLCAAIAPLIGLLGTVWGITQSFYDTTQLEVGQDRATALSRGIYIALVTTIGGLNIAIPATLMSHWFENRIIKLLNQTEEMVRGLLPQLERYEGVIRFTQPADAPPVTSGPQRNGPTGPEVRNGDSFGEPVDPVDALAAVPEPGRPRPPRRPVHKDVG